MPLKKCTDVADVLHASTALITFNPLMLGRAFLLGQHCMEAKRAFYTMAWSVVLDSVGLFL